MKDKQSKFMEKYSSHDSPTYSPRFHRRKGQEVRSPTRKRRELVYSDEESSTDGSKRSRSRSANLSSEFQKDTSVLERAAANWSGSEYEADYEPSRPETSIGKPDGEAESEHEASSGRSVDWEAEFEESEYEASRGRSVDWEAEFDNEASDYGSLKELNPDREETARKSVGSEYEASDRRNPWIAECDHGAAFLKCPIFTSNQSIDSRPVQNPDPNSRHEDQPAQPLIRASWAGNFAVASNGGRRPTFDGLSGCVSSKACSLARRVVERLPPVIEWEMVPKYCVWPESFERRGPTDNNIAAFFFPALTKYEAAYDSLVMELVRDDLALKTKVMGSELLLFTSVELPPLFTRFQGKLTCGEFSEAADLNCEYWF